jgi:hypothetical protein
MVLGLNNVKNFLPLLRGRVNSGWVVRANVQENYGVVLGVLEIFSEALEVEALSVGVVVAVVLPFLANNLNDTSVEWPGRIWSEDVDIFVRIPISKERETKTERASSRNTLGCSNTTLLQLSVISAIGKSKRLVNKGGNTFDGGILVIHVKVKNFLLSTSNTLEDVWLVLVVTVDSHTKQLLLGICLLLEGFV